MQNLFLIQFTPYVYLLNVFDIERSFLLQGAKQNVCRMTMISDTRMTVTEKASLFLVWSYSPKSSNKKHLPCYPSLETQAFILFRLVNMIKSTSVDKPMRSFNAHSGTYWPAISSFCLPLSLKQPSCACAEKRAALKIWVYDCLTCWCVPNNALPPLTTISSFECLLAMQVGFWSYNFPVGNCGKLMRLYNNIMICNISK